MKRLIALWLIAIVLMSSLCGCSTSQNHTSPEDAAQQSTVPETQAALHDNLINRVNPAEDIVLEDIVPFGNPGIIVAEERDRLPTQSENYAFQNSRVVIESEHFVYSIIKSTYLVDGCLDNFEKLYQVMEEVTGLSFQPPEDPMYEKIHAILDTGDNKGTDIGACSADASGRMIQIPQVDAFMGNTYEVISVLAHILQTDNARKTFNSVLDTGFMLYTTYKTLQYLEEHDPEFASRFIPSYRVLANMYIDDPSMLFTQTVPYWMEHEYSWEYSGNGSPSVGFYFMMYLDDVYEDYTKWIPEYANRYLCYLSEGDGSGRLNEQIQVLIDTYGENVYEGFYSWLENHLASYDIFSTSADYTTVSSLTFYPLFQFDGYSESFLWGSYNDLCVSLTEFRRYMTEFKEYNIDNLSLVMSEAVVALYDSEGKFITCTTGTQTPDEFYQVFLDDVYYIRFVGEGEVYAELRLE